MSETLSRSSLIAVVLDLNPLAWGFRAAQDAQRTSKSESFVKALDATLTFISSYLLMTHGNKVVVVGAHPLGAEILHPSKAYSGNTASMVNRQIEARVNELCRGVLLDETIADSKTSPASRFNNALSKALCFINKMRSEKDLPARLMVMKCGGDFLSHQYLPLINCAYAAEHLKVSIDTVVLEAETDVPVLQQMSDVTGGVYSRISEPAILLQSLLTYHLPDDDARKMLSKVPATPVDSRAVCFKTRAVTDIGYVCSVCLSVYKMLNPICVTCKSVLKLPGMPPSRKRKREK